MCDAGEPPHSGRARGWGRVGAGERDGTGGTARITVGEVEIT